ncbi:MAG: response regulator [Deltaproteobacteria bacterium]|nr:response regulator [Deltaproteobacteria bacterium]
MTTAVDVFGIVFASLKFETIHEEGIICVTIEHPWRIVLIDDEADIREVLSISLQDAGYEVAAASNGKAGLDLCDELDPQILITDIRMPGMDGLQVLEAAKKAHPEMEVIVATAYGEMDVAIRALQLDASDFITKPVSDEALHLALRRARERYEARRQVADYTLLLELENVETTRELLDSISFQRRLIDSSMDGILGCDRDGTVITFNRALEEMLGLSRYEVLGRRRVEAFFAEGDLRALERDLAEDRYGGAGRLSLYETRIRTLEGLSIPVQVSVTEILERGERDGLVFFFRDLRNIRRLEREMADQAKILHQDKMMSLGRLAASVVHEINNPLSGILNYARLMKRILERGRLTEEQIGKFRGYLDLVESETGRCSGIVSSLLSFSRRSRPEFTTVDVNGLLERSVLLSRHKMELQEIELKVDVPGDLPAVQGDPSQLQQCMINLIFNAIDAMPHGGRLTIRAAHDQAEGRLVVTVEDTGTGIDPASLPHIFEPFFTTKQEGYGVGLGLSTVYGIVERHHGAVEVESRPGGGRTVFTIRLPV